MASAMLAIPGPLSIARMRASGPRRLCHAGQHHLAPAAMHQDIARSFSGKQREFARSGLVEIQPLRGQQRGAPTSPTELASVTATHSVNAISIESL